MPFSVSLSVNSFSACCARATARPYPGTITTVSALPSMNDASSAEPDFTGRCSVDPPAAAAPASLPKPPRITLKNERFIARHMMYERIAPEEPTSEPAMISIGLFSEKPMPTAAQPEYELSIDTTTGMSAPPIGMMISTPSANAISVMMMNGSHDWVRKKITPKPTMPMASIRLIRCCPAYTTGAPWKSRNLYLPDSLPNAITEPENVIAPTNVPMKSSMRLPYGRNPGTGLSGSTSPNADGSDTTA